MSNDVKWFLQLAVLTTLAVVLSLGQAGQCDAQNGGDGPDAAQDVNTTKFKEINLDKGWPNVNPKLREIFEAQNTANNIAYELTEGIPFAMSVGTFVVGELPNGDIVWLVEGIIDSGLRVSIIKAVAYVEKTRWEAEITKAKTNGIPMPSLAAFIPDQYVQIMGDDEPLKYRGSYFKR